MRSDYYFGVIIFTKPIRIFFSTSPNATKKSTSKLEAEQPYLQSVVSFFAAFFSGNGGRLITQRNGFFSSLVWLLEDVGAASFDNTEFLFRRLDEYERPLLTLLSRFIKTYGGVPAQQNTITDLTYLCNNVGFLRSQLEWQCMIDFVDDNSTGNRRHGSVLSFENNYS